MEMQIIFLTKASKIPSLSVVWLESYQEGKVGRFELASEIVCNTRYDSLPICCRSRIYLHMHTEASDSIG